MKRLLKSKRAVSQVFTTVLLILLVVSGMTVVFAFLVSYVQDFQTGQGSAVLENFAFENIWFKGTNEIEVTIYNYGKIDLNIQSIYIDGLAFGFSIKNYDNNEVPPGGHRTAIINPIPFTSNTAYQFKIVTQRGSTIESYSTSPEDIS
jgi:hypothetical protein